MLQKKTGKVEIVLKFPSWCGTKCLSVSVCTISISVCTITIKEKKNKIVGLFVAADQELLPSQSRPISWRLTCALRQKVNQQAPKCTKSGKTQTTLFNPHCFASGPAEHPERDTATEMREDYFSFFLHSVHMCLFLMIFTWTVSRKQKIRLCFKKKNTNTHCPRAFLSDNKLMPSRLFANRKAVLTLKS